MIYQSPHYAFILGTFQVAMIGPACEPSLMRWQLPGTQGNIPQILLNQTELRLYLPCTDWFGTANGYFPIVLPNRSENGKYNLISDWFNKISKRFLCVYVNLSDSWRAPWNPSNHHSTMSLKGLRGAINWASIMPRHTSLWTADVHFSAWYFAIKLTTN